MRLITDGNLIETGEPRCPMAADLGQLIDMPTLPSDTVVILAGPSLGQALLWAMSLMAQNRGDQVTADHAELHARELREAAEDAELGVS